MFDGISYGKGSAFLKQSYKMLGYDVIKKGLHAYFAKHAWGNTTLPDFVDQMQIAYNEGGDKSLGDNFSVQKWCDEWLCTSGINIFTPKYEDGKLSITQSMSLRGKNRLRKQRIDIALYDQDANLFVIENHVISEADEVTEVDLKSVPSDFKVAAVYINHGNHAYCKVRFDKASINWFTENFSKV